MELGSKIKNLWQQSSRVADSQLTTTLWAKDNQTAIIVKVGRSGPQ